MTNKGFITFDVVVIGAGAAGFMAAITAARNGKKVAIIEHKDRPGKKILATGNGKCNYTNAKMNEECFRGNVDLIHSSFHKFADKDTISFFRGLGIVPKSKNGYFYPNSESAASILKALEMETKKFGIKTYTSVNVTGIEPISQGFNIYVDGFMYVCSKLVIATGLTASPKLGSDGSIFPIIKSLGHSFTNIVPALCGLKCHGFDFKKASGVRCDAVVSAIVKDTQVCSERGELQLADYGVSGIPIFQISRYASVAVAEGEKCQVKIEFLPEYTMDDIVKYLLEFVDILGDKCTSLDLFNGFFNDKLSLAILKYAGVSEKKTIDNMTRDDITMLAKAIKETVVTVDAARGFDFAQVCAGGIKTEEIDIETLESKIVRNMYFAGEILDVDGICGGYNLQWAWTSGFIAGNSVSR